MPASGTAAVFLAALRLGLTSFGGPVAHIEYFRRAYVERLHWVDDREFADLVTMSQVLPGPASSQLGMAIGMRRRGWAGLIAAWAGFTLPSALLMAIFGIVATRFDLAQPLHGLKLAAIAVVVMAVISLARTTLRTRASVLIAAVAGVTAGAVPTSWMHVLLIALGALAGRAVLVGTSTPTFGAIPAVRPRATILALVALVLPFALLPLLRSPLGELLDAIYRSGALVFGGGHVVLPLLEAGVVRTGLVDPNAFLAGYGAAQAIPGPLFTFASYLGAVTQGWWGAVAATLVIFLPSGLLVVAALPYWRRWQHDVNVRGAINGANAAVVGLLASVPFLPITRSAIASPWDIMIVVLAFAALASRRVPVVVVVVACAAAGLVTTW